MKSLECNETCNVDGFPCNRKKTSLHRISKYQLVRSLIFLYKNFWAFQRLFLDYLYPWNMLYICEKKMYWEMVHAKYIVLLDIFKKKSYQQVSDRFWKKSGHTFAFVRINKIAKTLASSNGSLNDIYVSENDDEWFQAVQLFKERFSVESNLTIILN